jgi:CheY-like chemotaxis protein
MGATPTPVAEPPLSNENDTAVKPKQFHVLVAEDNAINALLATKVIERAGGLATLAEDGRFAIDFVRLSIEGALPPFDIILMDLEMPGVDGLSAAKSIQELYAAGAIFSPPPLIALTANAFPEDRERCKAAGFNDFLAKPFDLDNLEGLLRRWLQGKARPRGA